MEDKLSEQI